MSKALEARLAEIESRLEVLAASCDKAMELIEELRSRMGSTAEGDPFFEELNKLSTTVDEIRTKVESRNKSAPVKRNMTDEDAVRVLQGPESSMGHKEAAAAVGLTYAQVYSCRLGFTFKHVHRDLEKAGWESRWAKG